jgi:hypothetical protein
MRGFFFGFLKYFTQPSDSTVSEDAGVEPRPLALTVTTARRSKRSATDLIQIFNYSYSIFDVDSKRRREWNPETGIQKLQWRRRCAVYRRVQGLEEDLEKSEEKLIIANQKLDKVNTT